MPRSRALAVLCGAWIALALGSSGCGSKGSGGAGAASTAPAAAAAAFGVVATDPRDGERDVAVDATLYVTFSGDLDPASLAGAVTLRTDAGAVPTRASAITARVVAVQPTGFLVSAKDHLLVISGTVRDRTGRSLGADVAVRFTTRAAVPVVGAGPPLAASGGTVPTSAPPPPAVASPYRAGVATADITPPVGVPLAGYGGGGRRRLFPDLDPTNYHTFLVPSRGVRDRLEAKALVLANGSEEVCILTLDAIATDAELVAEAHRRARARGFGLPLEKVLACSSHTHSGPGALTRRMFWELLAADLYVPRVADFVAERIADALVAAERNLQPARVGVGTAQVVGATRNRRAADSPALDPDSVDPELLVIRVDRADGSPLATVWNFAIHGTYFDSHNLDYSADIMGEASARGEARGAGECLFVNGAEGDLEPDGSLAAVATKLADGILAARAAAVPRASGILQSTHQQVDLGTPTLDAGLRHLGSSAQSNWFVQGLRRLGISPHVRFRLPSGWMEREFRFQAVRIGDSVIASMPGEPIHEIGLGIKNDGRALGFAHVLPAGLANGHGAYFTTPAEYGFGGYEGLASMFGDQGGQRLRAACLAVMRRVRP
ncbi:MAG: hypothetical protein D6731_11545 [Planctomycetota bacterium]|nr:MAG: hypothetical protein D6731_11545 [Planctomycetota bacterium]